eukprot:7208548-Pyramimonas_sp.AAC.1
MARAWTTQDVPQVQYAAKMIMVEASKPSPLAESQIQSCCTDLPVAADVEGDGDWAGADDAKSTQCTVMMFGDHLPRGDDVNAGLRGDVKR